MKWSYNDFLLTLKLRSTEKEVYDNTACMINVVVVVLKIEFSCVRLKFCWDSNVTKFDFLIYIYI